MKTVASKKELGLGWIWQNGRLVHEGAARIDPSDRGLLLGDGLFETMLATHNEVPLLPRHLARLLASAVKLGIPVPYDAAQFTAAIRSLLDVEALSQAAVRLTLTRGPGPRGLAIPSCTLPTVMIRAFPSMTSSPPSPARAIVSSVPRNERSPTSGMKTLACLDQVLALRQARERGCDDAIMLNTAGQVACATAANVFVAMGGTITTPDLHQGILPGVTRARLLERWPHVRERPLTQADLASADEIFLTNSLIGVRPLVELDSKPIGSGQPGPITCEAADILWSR
jgi:branched-chain amino acid aminotransferase